MSHQCPRRGETNGAFNLPEHDEYLTRSGVERAVCSYCGSVSGDDLMAYLEAGGELTPTDKNYKGYLANPWGKIYYQHLTEEQKRRFVDLVNEGKLKIGDPGHFYVSPFFMARRSENGGD